MPRRSDDSVRVGLYWIVRASRSSKLSKLSGPLMNSAMVDDFFSFTPGVTSTSTTRRTSSGAWSARAIVVIPPSDMPMTAWASGANARIATATSSAFETTSTEPLRPPSEWPCPGRSIATSGRSSAIATVSHVCAFCAPPWRNTSSGSASPQTSALSRRPGSISTDSRRTVGGPSYGSPNSSAFSWNRENSS
jgi:hypothetical protein